MIPRRWLEVLLLVVVITSSQCEIFSKPEHKTNQALILSSSRYWFNYRHAINALSIYSILKKNGFDDENIVLMLADEFPGNPRNPFRNQMYGTGINGDSLFSQDTQVDYRGDDVTVDNLRKVLLGKGTKRVLRMDNSSNVLIYWTGHGGDSFFKFQDMEEVTAIDIARFFDEMEYNELLFIADTCQAFTLGNEITAPNVYMIGSSLKDENSYAHHSDNDIGLSVIERYTYRLTELIQRRGIRGTLTQTLVDPFDYKEQRAHVGVKQSSCKRSINEALMEDFFSVPPSETAVEVMEDVAAFSWDKIPSFEA